MNAAERICEFGRLAYERGLVSGTEGNLSLLRDDGVIVCTPRGACKGRLSVEQICEVDLCGRQCGGTRTASSESGLHVEIYRAALGLDMLDAPTEMDHSSNALRAAIAASRVRAVVHTHPPFATTFALLGEAPPAGFLPEAEVFLGRVPLIPYETPGTPAVGRAVRPFVANHVAAILQNHGAVAWGGSVEEAFVRTETLESVCRVIYQARLIGTPRPIPADRLAELRKNRS